MTYKLSIDGKKVTAKPGESLLDVALKAGAEIPFLCHHEMIKPYGACRLCLVEVTHKGRKKLTTSCNYEVQDGISVVTDNPEIKKHRKMVLELLAAMAPDSKRVTGLAKVYGVNTPQFKKLIDKKKRANCILCGLCSRVCEEVVGANALAMSGRGYNKDLVVPFEDRILDSCIGCGACAFVCPTGAIDMEKVFTGINLKNKASSRQCRHALMGHMNGSLCPNNYDCAVCEVDQRFVESARPHHPVFAARNLVPFRGVESEE